MKSVSREEADVSLAQEYHMSLEQVRRLNLYDKRLMMGWVPFDRERAAEEARKKVAGLQSMVRKFGVK